MLIINLFRKSNKANMCFIAFICCISLRCLYMNFALNFVFIVSFRYLTSILLSLNFKMSQLDGTILSFLFDNRYMDFETCSHLRLVSAQFNFHATRYFRSLREFDLEKFVSERGVKYDCLLETVTENCDNLEKISGIWVTLKVKLVSKISLRKLPKLTSIVANDCGFDPIVLFDLLKALPNLRSVKVNGWVYDGPSSGEEAGAENEGRPEEEKVVVSELSWEAGDFWRIFRADRLEKLSVSIYMLGSTRTDDAFFNVVGRCPLLEQLEVGIHASCDDHLQPLMRLTAVLPRLQQLSINLNCDFENLEDVTRMLRQNPSVGKYVKKFYTEDPGPSGD